MQLPVPRVRPPLPPWVLIQPQMSPAVREHLPGVLSVLGTEDTAVTRSALIQEPYVPVGEPDIRQISVKSTTGSHTRACTWLCVCARACGVDSALVSVQQVYWAHAVTR